MPTLAVDVPHHHSADEAKKRVENWLATLKKQHSASIDDASLTWNGQAADFSCTARGFSISGSLKVTDSAVAVQLKLPFALVVVKGRIQSALVDSLTDALR